MSVLCSCFRSASPASATSSKGLLVGLGNAVLTSEHIRALWSAWILLLMPHPKSHRSAHFPTAVLCPCLRFVSSLPLTSCWWRKPGRSHCHPAAVSCCWSTTRLWEDFGIAAHEIRHHGHHQAPCPAAGSPTPLPDPSQASPPASQPSQLGKLQLSLPPFVPHKS